MGMLAGYETQSTEKNVRICGCADVRMHLFEATFQRSYVSLCGKEGQLNAFAHPQIRTSAHTHGIVSFALSL